MSSDLSFRTSRTRRNLLRMGGIAMTAAAATLASSKIGRANPGKGKGIGQGVGGGRGHTQCLLKGATVATASGARKVEELAIGDLVPTAFGAIRPVQWIARYVMTRHSPSKPWPESLRPIHILPSAIAPGVPNRDLYLSAEHALLIDGVLVTAGSLVNDITIRRFDPGQCGQMEYFHVKLDGHDVIYADGAPVETMLKADENAVNFDEYVALYGEPRDETRCAPLLSCTGPRRELGSRARSALSPWIDRRQKVDLIRDRLEDRALMAAAA